MELFNHYFELTLNLLATPFVMTIIGCLIVWAIQRVVSALINAKEVRDNERHKTLMDKMDTLCLENRDDHGRVFEKLDDHEHRISYLEGAKSNVHKKVLG